MKYLCYPFAFLLLTMFVCAANVQKIADLDSTHFLNSGVGWEDLNSGVQKWYQVLGPYDADPNNGSISYTAPLGKALIGKEEGDSVIFKTPGGIQELEILKIE